MPARAKKTSTVSKGTSEVLRNFILFVLAISSVVLLVTFFL